MAEKFFSFYICLRAVDSTGQPPRTSTVADSVYFNSSSEEFVAVSIECRFSEFFRKLLQCTQCFETPLELFQAQQVENPVTNNAFWTNVLNGNFKISEKKNGGKPRPILIIVDEARGLKGVDSNDHSQSSIYMGLRRALAADSRDFLCIMIDTNAKISNFAPVFADDPSGRVSSGEKLFHPWSCIPTIDLELSLPAIVAKVDESVQCGGSKSFHYNRFNVLKYSRPMFTYAKLFLSVDPNLVTFEILWLQLMDLAHEKLFGKKKAEEIDSLDMMAALAGRFCLVPVDMTTKASLVANKMATLQACSVGRRRMAVDYVVEPVLGESFAHFMTVHFEGIMNALSHLMGSGQLSLAGSKGDYGELMAAIIMTRAYDIKHRLIDRHYSKPVMVQDILSLFQADDGTGTGKLVITEKEKRSSGRKKGKRKDSTLILRSLVRYLQFTRLRKPLSAVELAAGFQRCAAFLTAAGTVACDLVIPILLGEQEQSLPGMVS